MACNTTQQLETVMRAWQRYGHEVLLFSIVCACQFIWTHLGCSVCTCSMFGMWAYVLLTCLRCVMVVLAGRVCSCLLLYLQQYNSVSKWTKDFDIFEKDFLIVPVNLRWVNHLCAPQSFLFSPKWHQRSVYRLDLYDLYCNFPINPFFVPPCTTDKANYM